MEKLRNVFAEDGLDSLMVKLRFGNIDPTVWKVDGQFRCELSPNEAHSYDYVRQHGYFNVAMTVVRAKLKDLGAHGYYSYPPMLIENFWGNVESVQNTMGYVARCEGVVPHMQQIQGVELEHRYARIFRACDMLLPK